MCPEKLFFQRRNKTLAQPVFTDMRNAQPEFQALVEAHSAGLFRFAYWLCRDRGRAEDLVQETFLRAWRALGDLREARAARGWLTTILRREHARLHERYTPEIAEIDPDDIAAEAAAPIETLLLRQELLRLSEEYREPLLMQVLGGLSGEEIAAAMNLAPSTVMTRLFRARQKLRAALAVSGTAKQRQGT
jgi:RNA polymerase sigma-70 factor (ECF subfamily)